MLSVRQNFTIPRDVRRKVGRKIRGKIRGNIPEDRNDRLFVDLEAENGSRDDERSDEARKPFRRVFIDATMALFRGRHVGWPEGNV